MLRIQTIRINNQNKDGKGFNPCRLGFWESKKGDRGTCWPPSLFQTFSLVILDQAEGLPALPPFVF